MGNGPGEIHGRLHSYATIWEREKFGRIANVLIAGDIADNVRATGFFHRIGYGLDYKELSCNLPYLAKLREGKTV